MIKFALGCENEHEFEGWFDSNHEYSRLQKQGLVTCPICNSVKVEKLLMAPAIPKKSNIVAPAQMISDGASNDNNSELSLKIPVDIKGAIAPLENSITTAVAVPELPAHLSDAHSEMVEKIRDFKKHVIDNTEDVGENFVEEARKIHFGESEKRGIHGKANLEEAIELVEEGIEVMPIPELPEDKN